jgi:hypothetical protein
MTKPDRQETSLAEPQVQAAVVCNATGAADAYLATGSGSNFRRIPTGPAFALDLDGIDLLLVPNGTDHVAMARAVPAVLAFLERGGTLACFDGWVTPWVPGHEWVMDNQYRTIDVRYRAGRDRFGLLEGVDIEALTFRHGISGWWACGYIEAARGADLLLGDIWGRPIMVVDTTTTPGAMILTASGPVGPATEVADQSARALDRLYDNILKFAAQRAEGRKAT